MFLQKMSTLEMSHIDLECGLFHEEQQHQQQQISDFSDGDEESCNSQLYSTADGDSENLDIENCENNLNFDKLVVERDCRICHLSLVSSSPGSGVAIELGCSCKDDLAAAHKHCAETWFKIKGNKTCEICNSVALNVVGPNDMEAMHHLGSENGDGVSTTTSTAPVLSENRSCLNGHRFLNFLLACMVFAFVISWLFHFNISS